MKRLLSIVILSFVFQACSSPQPKNSWQYNASSALKAYTQHYLQGNTVRAKADLSRARKQATRSADLHTLINIELSVCAMYIATLKPPVCKNAADLLVIEPDPTQKAYLDLLTSKISLTQIRDLPTQYQAFSSALVKADIDELNERIANITPLSSRLIASALIKGHLDETNIQSLIDTLSYHGYKTPMLSWLRFQLEKEQDPEKKAKMKAKLEVLISH